jgi:heme/copper-type cytochrome/quinol oxidase subunit 4
MPMKQTYNQKVLAVVASIGFVVLAPLFFFFWMSVASDHDNQANFGALLLGLLIASPIIAIVGGGIWAIIWAMNKGIQNKKEWLAQLPPPPPGAWQDPSGVWHSPAQYHFVYQPQARDPYGWPDPRY